MPQRKEDQDRGRRGFSLTRKDLPFYRREGEKKKLARASAVQKSDSSMRIPRDADRSDTGVGATQK